jgi:hypothetical protein
VDFPSNFTYCSLYKHYCYGRGWLAKDDNKGGYPRLEDYNNRKEDNCLFKEDNMVTEKVFSWWSFRYIWKTDLPKIRIRAPCNATCGECTILRNAFCYREMQHRNNEISKSSSSDIYEEEERPIDLKVGEEEVIHLAKILLTFDCVRQEAILEEAGFHFTQARAMVQHQTTDSIESVISLKRNNGGDLVLVCDYTQNINSPHYGGEHPGEIYYLSARTINLFGIVDLSVTPNKLNCYAYRESTGKKGEQQRCINAYA